MKTHLRSLTVTWFLFTALGFASTTTQLFNEEEFTVGRGDLETSFRIDTDIVRGDTDSERFALNLGGNYFLSDVFAPGLDVIVNYAEGAGTSAHFIPNVKAYWPLHSRVLPFLQAGIGYSHVPGDDGFAFGFGAGLNYLLSNSVAVGAKLAYEITAGDDTAHRISIPMGFAIYFKI